MKFIIPWNELEVAVTRSSGAGGQHVNRTNSAVQLRFDIEKSLVLTPEQKNQIMQRLASKLVQGTQLLVKCEEQRDQKRNKETAYAMLNRLIELALIKPKKRVKTKPTKSSVKTRLDEKNIRSEIKKNRSKKIDWSG